VLRARPNSEAHARLGIIAGKKAAARAVDRNRGKRLIREAFRSFGGSIGAYDITVQLRGDLRSEPASALRVELRELLETLGRRRFKSLQFADT
jgi:ribonuclease P protein component